MHRSGTILYKLDFLLILFLFTLLLRKAFSIFGLFSIPAFCSREWVDTRARWPFRVSLGPSRSPNESGLPDNNTFDTVETRPRSPIFRPHLSGDKEEKKKGNNKHTFLYSRSDRHSKTRIQDRVILSHWNNTKCHDGRWLFLRTSVVDGWADVPALCKAAGAATRGWAVDIYHYIILFSLILFITSLSRLHLPRVWSMMNQYHLR